MAIWQLCANLLIPNCLRSNLSYSPLAALELYVKIVNLKVFCFLFTTSFQNDQISHFSFPYIPHIFSLLLSHRLVIYYDPKRE